MIEKIICSRFVTFQDLKIRKATKVNLLSDNFYKLNY